MPNGRYCGSSPQTRGFSKNAQWGAGISELLKGMRMMRRFRQAQAQKKWQRGITEELEGIK